MNSIDGKARCFYAIIFILCHFFRVSVIPIFDHQWIAFKQEDAIFSGANSDDLRSLAYHAGEFLLAIDAQGVIRDVAGMPDFVDWLDGLCGKKISETVTPDSVEKAENISAQAHIKPHQERHINHLVGERNIPVSYRFMSLDGGKWLLAMGRNLEQLASLQQRTLTAQQVIERDYINLRQTESRYRVLFQSIIAPTLIIDAKTRIIEQANTACEDLFGLDVRTLANKDFLDLFDKPSQHLVLGYFGALSVSDAIPSVTLTLAPSPNMPQPQEIETSATIFRQGKQSYLLVTMGSDMRANILPEKYRNIEAMMEQLPDAMVLADGALNIIYANPAFLILLNAHSPEQLHQTALQKFIGRPAVDLNLLKRELDSNGNVRNFASIVNDVNGQTEQVEISAALIEGEERYYAFSLRNVGRRERDLAPIMRSELQSVDQLTSLVGRKSLKHIVRESTDLIESMCIQAALKHTGDNRASAAEILGVSRQSLYSKMRLYELGNKDED